MWYNEGLSPDRGNQEPLNLNLRRKPCPRARHEGGDVKGRLALSAMAFPIFRSFPYLQ